MEFEVSRVLESFTKIMQNQCHIVIVNYNAGEWLLRSVRSALQFSSGRVTVVDNASQDQSMQILAQQWPDEPRLELIQNKQNLGFAAANNQVLEKLQADYAVLLNPDCELHEDTLPALFNALENDSELGLLSCRILYEDGRLQATSRRRFPTPWSAFVRLLGLHLMFPNNPKYQNFDYGDKPILAGQVETVEAVSGAFMVARRTAIAEVGLLDEAYFMHCEDLDWCKRFALAGWKVGFVGDVAVVHAKGVSSESRPIRVLWTLHRGMNRFFDKFYQSDYPFWLRALVKIGIVGSLVLRSIMSIGKSLRSWIGK